MCSPIIKDGQTLINTASRAHSALFKKPYYSQLFGLKPDEIAGGLSLVIIVTIYYYSLLL